MKRILLGMMMVLLANAAWAQSATKVIKGVVTDAASGEALIGAIVRVKNQTKQATTTGLDGTFAIKTQVAQPIVCCTYLGYRPVEVAYADTVLAIRMEETNRSLSEVVIKSNFNGSTDAKAMEIERFSANVVNVLGSRAMELAPDVTVGNIVQKISGVTVERNSSGEGQYAILRGMDKRYNYTLVNGIKIPSPDNKNRFVPLDLFPLSLIHI